MCSEHSTTRIQRLWRVSPFAAAAVLAALSGCATAVLDDVPGDPETSDPSPSQPLPDSRADGSSPIEGDGGGDGGTDAVAEDGPGTGPRDVTIKLVPSQSDWIVAGQPAPFKVNKDAKNCDLFGNNCDANVELQLWIDAPAAAPASLASCSRKQKGTGFRQCAEGTGVVKTATLSPGDVVKVRFHAEAVDDPGKNPKCDIDKTWSFTGTDFVLNGEPLPASGAWGCIGGGSGQDLDVALAYKLAL